MPTLLSINALGRHDWLHVICSAHTWSASKRQVESHGFDQSHRPSPTGSDEERMKGGRKVGAAGARISTVDTYVHV